MSPNIEHQQSNAKPNSPSPVEYKDDDQSFCTDSHNLDSLHNSQPVPKSKEPGQAGPTFLSRLSQLPIQRSMPWRAGQELPSERSSDSDRVQQRGASLLATRGSIATEPCTQCAAGRGRFSHCIALGNWFQGACSSCVFTSRGNRCTLRLQRGKVDGRSARHQPVEEGGMNENPTPRAKKRRRKTSEKDITIANLINKPDVQDPYPSTTAATVGSPQTVSPDRAFGPVKVEVSNERPNGLSSYGHSTEKKQKRYHDLPGGYNMPDTINRGLPRYQEPPTDQPAPREGGFGGFTAVNRTPTSYNHGPPELIKILPPPVSSNLPVRAPLPAPIDVRESVPFIDTLPKSKQRQIFGLISGIQGGIDHLQKQLNLLQSTLGTEINMESRGEKAG